MTSPHFRQCFDCGNVDVHGDSIRPAVCCSKCLSADTRKFRTPEPAAAADVAAPGATLDLTWLFLNHALVRAAIKSGATPQQVILLLAATNADLLGRIVRSEFVKPADQEVD